MTKLVLIDGNAVLHRAYHALPLLTSKDGTQINAVYGFVSMLFRIITDLKPTHIAVAFDTPKPTFRHAEYVGYQAHRPRMDSELSGQFQITYKVLDAMGINMYSLPGYEADDVIGTIVEQTKQKDTKIQRDKDIEKKKVSLNIPVSQYPSIDSVVIVTGDRDILQLVNDKLNIKLYMPVKGLSDAKLYGEKEVFERMGVAPSQIVDYKALAGDSSDNYPGVTGIGPKTASNLIQKYKTLESIYEHLSELPENQAKKLALGAEPAALAKKLATIVRDVPVTFKLEECDKWDITSPQAVKVYEEISFKSLAARATKLGAQIAKEKQLSLI